MNSWHYMVMGLSALLTIFLCLKELRRRDRRRLAFRLLASVVGVASLACMVVPVPLQKTVRTGRINEAVLLTEGFNQDSVDRYLKSRKGLLRVYQQDSLAWIDSSLAALHVFGCGLSPYEMDLVKNIPMVFYPAAITGGITAAHWRQKLRSGEQLVVQGTYLNKKSRPIKIVLEGLNTTLDSLIIPPGKNDAFELAAIPKHLGKSIYYLVFSDQSGVLEKQPLPVEVSTTGKLKILSLAAAPDFEKKFLKNWLSENGYAIVSRTRISQSKYEKSFINTKTVNLDKITSGLLDPFDVIIADASELAVLTKTELSAVHTAVIKGIGLIIQADSVKETAAFYESPFTRFRVPGKPAHAPVLFIRGLPLPTAPLIADQVIYTRSKAGVQALVLDSSSNIAVSSSLEGSGKIVYSGINNSFQWMLAGNRKDYQVFWSVLLQEAARKTSDGQQLIIPAEMPALNEPVGLYIETAALDMPVMHIDNGPVSLRQNPHLPFQWQGVYWPAKTGWQPAVHSGWRQHEWFAYGTGDWKNIKAIEKIGYTKRTIDETRILREKASGSHLKIRATLPEGYVFFVFILCCGFLWAEKKLSGRGK